MAPSSAFIAHSRLLFMLHTNFSYTKRIQRNFCAYKEYFSVSYFLNIIMIFVSHYNTHIHEIFKRENTENCLARGTRILELNESLSSEKNFAIILRQSQAAIF